MGKQYAQMPVTGGVRKSRNRGPTMTSNGDSAIVKYSGPGLMQTQDSNGKCGGYRVYVPGHPNGWANPSGPSVVSFYSTGKFVPGTTIRWEPACSFTTAGRVYSCFTDNPEVTSFLQQLITTYYSSPSTLAWTNYINQVRAMGTSRSWPVWQETEIPFPTKLRRKRFDINRDIGGFGINDLDRCAQTTMFFAIDCPDPDVDTGSFQFHDVVDVEGMQAGITT